MREEIEDPGMDTIIVSARSDGGVNVAFRWHDDDASNGLWIAKDRHRYEQLMQALIAAGEEAFGGRREDPRIEVRMLNVPEDNGDGRYDETIRFSVDIGTEHQVFRIEPMAAKITHIDPVLEAIMGLNDGD